MAPLQPPACGKPHEKYMLKKKEEYAKSKTAVAPPTQARGFDDPFEVDPVEANKPTSGKAFCGCCPGAATPLPIETVDLEAYSGHWYQVYASCIPKWLFECGGLATTADYGPVDGIEATALSVKNFGRCFPCFAQMCPTKCPGWGLKGFVVQSPDDAQGALTVSLGPCATVKCCGGGPEKAKYKAPGNYHIIKLGPIVDGLYDYSVVSNASPASQLYILTRDTARFKAEYEEEVLAFVKVGDEVGSALSPSTADRLSPTRAGGGLCQLLQPTAINLPVQGPKVLTWDSRTSLHVYTVCQHRLWRQPPRIFRICKAAAMRLQSRGKGKRPPRGRTGDRAGGAHSISSLTQRQPRSAARGGTDAHTHHIYSILSLYWNRILLEEP